MELREAMKLAQVRAKAFLISSMIIGLTGIFCSAPILASSKIAPAEITHPVKTQQSSFIYALNNSSLPLKQEVTKLYQLRNYDLIWSDGKQYNANALELYELIQQADDFGLNPVDYDVDVIQYFLESTITDANLLRKSDISFTHAYINLQVILKKAGTLEQGLYTLTNFL